jgi:hypothetical protein
MIESIHSDIPRTIAFKLSGKLHDEDYKTFVPAVEAAMTGKEKVPLFVQFEDFHGWDMHAMWDDTKFAMKHYSDFERIALVSERRWQKWMAQVCKPFTHAKVRHFDRFEIEETWKWLREGVEEPIPA